MPAGRTLVAYQGEEGGFQRGLKDSRARYLDLQSSLGDDVFHDSVHPKLAAAIKLRHLIDEAVIQRSKGS